MTDEERIDDAYERIDIDTDEILAFYDGERVERCLKSIWDSTVTMHQVATVALKENAEMRELLSMYMTFARTVASGISIQSAYVDGMGRKLDEVEMRERAMELGIERCR